MRADFLETPPLQTQFSLPPQPPSQSQSRSRSQSQSQSQSHPQSMSQPASLADRYKLEIPLRSQTARPPVDDSADLQDPIQLHLLTETAKADSSKYQILPPDVVDRLKREYAQLETRIRQARANLALQIRYRDAARSVAKLGLGPGLGPGGTSGHLAALSKTPGDADAEYQRCKRMCDELSLQLWTLEKRMVYPQRKLLEHTAAILYYTHRAATAGPAASVPAATAGPHPSVGAAPASPPLSHTSLQDAEYGFDMLIRDLDTTPDGDNTRTMSRSKSAPSNDRANDHANALATVTRQLAHVNQTLYSLLREASADIEAPPPMESGSPLPDTTPPPTDGHPSPEVTGPPAQLAYLDQALLHLRTHQQTLAQANDSLTHTNETLTDDIATTSQMLSRTEQRVEEINQYVCDILSSLQIAEPPRPLSSSTALDKGLTHLQNVLQVLEREAVQLARAAREQPSHPDSDVQRELDTMDAELRATWAHLQAQYAARRDRTTDSLGGGGGEEAIVGGLMVADGRRSPHVSRSPSPSSPSTPADDRFLAGHEEYSLEAFVEYVQTLATRAQHLTEQKHVLQRQIKQQRELNSHASAGLHEEMAHLREHADQAEEAREEAVRRQQEVEQRLDHVLGEQRETGQRLDEAMARQAEIEQAREEAGRRLDEALRQHRQAEAERDTALSQQKDAEQTLDELRHTLASVKTELTFARAELDGAQGSRSERAAAQQVTAHVTSLEQQVAELRAELADTVRQLEDVTAEAITAERQNTFLEAKVDEVLAARQSLRRRLEADLEAAHRELETVKEDLAGQKLQNAMAMAARGASSSRRDGPSSSSTGSSSTGSSTAASSAPGGAWRLATAGATALSEQFRTTMREERKRYQEELREERSRRKHLEEELAQLRLRTGLSVKPEGPSEGRAEEVSRGQAEKTSGRQAEEASGQTEETSGQTERTARTARTEKTDQSSNSGKTANSETSKTLESREMSEESKRAEKTSETFETFD